MHSPGACQGRTLELSATASIFDELSVSEELEIVPQAVEHPKHDKAQRAIPFHGTAHGAKNIRKSRMYGAPHFSQGFTLGSMQARPFRAQKRGFPRFGPVRICPEPRVTHYRTVDLANENALRSGLN